MNILLPKFFKGKWHYLLSLMLISNLIYAQQTTVVTGVVKDEKGVVLPGVGVKSKSGTTSTVTNGDGKFTISVSNTNETLVFTYVGYKQAEIALSGKTVLNVNLVSDDQKLNEIVIVGYGTQKKVNLTGAVSVVSAEDISNKTAINTSTALQGLAPGVTVTQSTGQPGSTGTIRIRGIGTLGNAGPLVLIDGVEGDIDNIDPNLIENVSILKDAASSSIYGSRAANGVILITTKRAKAGLSVNYSGYTGWQSPTNLPDKVNALDHMTLTNEAYVNTGKAPLYSDALLAQYAAGMTTNPDLYPNTDWQKEVLVGSGFMQSHFLSLNGGGEKIKFLTSAGIVDQKGIIQNSNFQRITLRTNADITFSDKFSMKMDLQIDNKLTNEPGRGNEAVFIR
jgi:TonB-linked SusC/RagA family outer membrane protein